MAQRIGNEKISGGGYTGKEKPEKSVTMGKPFRLLVRHRESKDPNLVGSYPFLSGDRGDPEEFMSHKHRGYFSMWDGKPDYYNYVD